MFDLPQSAVVDRIVPKTKFYEHASIPTAVRDEFTQVIGRITWKYKLSASTINLPATHKIEEIQIFMIELKAKQIPIKALTAIDKAIPYPILYVLTHGNHAAYVIQHKLDSANRYYSTDWDHLPQLAFTGTNLEATYQAIITQFIAANNTHYHTRLFKTDDKSFEEVVADDTRRRQLEKDIKALESKIRGERQFSRQVSLNTELQTLRTQLSTSE